MKKAFSGFIVGLVVAFAAVGVVATVDAATGGTGHHQHAGVVPIQRRVDQAVMPRACFSLQCINRSLRVLNREVFRCERLVDVAQFSDYQSTTPGVPNSALDLATPGTGTYSVVYDRC
jgi:hypothetical protein